MLQFLDVFFQFESVFVVGENGLLIRWDYRRLIDLLEVPNQLIKELSLVHKYSNLYNDRLTFALYINIFSKSSMNTYSSVKYLYSYRRSFDSQIHGRKVVEPNIAVTHNRHHQSPKLHSPEQNLDQFTEKKLLIKPPKKRKIAQSQGQQGKPTK